MREDESTWPLHVTLAKPCLPLLPSPNLHFWSVMSRAPCSLITTPRLPPLPARGQELKDTSCQAQCLHPAEPKSPGPRSHSPADRSAHESAASQGRKAL